MLGDLSTLGYKAHKEPVPSKVLRFLYFIFLHLARNSNQDYAHTENGFGMISHRWVTFIAGVGFYIHVGD